ncbi:MAG: hypothetical protein ACO3EZ_17895 [Prochlorotrichaceae cyanobacterium]
MLCLSCDRQSICLVNQLAETNLKLKTLLEKLKVCEMRITSGRSQQETCIR